MKKGSNPPPPAGRKPAPPANPPGPGALIIAAMATRLGEQIATHPEETVRRLLDETERKAWVSLARYKFLTFGHHAAQWVLLKSLMPAHVRNPFASLVRFAKAEVANRGLDTKEDSDG